MADLVSYGLEGLVALGTIGATALAIYQLRRDRRDSLRRELADRIYVPMRKRAQAWLDPESPPYSLPRWAELSEDFPYLTRKVPSKLRELLANGESVESETFTYGGPTTSLMSEFSRDHTPGTNARINVRQSSKEDQFLGEVYPINIWRSGKTLDEYIADFVSKRWPLVKGWNLEMIADVKFPGGGTTVGKVGTDDDVRKYVEELMKFLESNRHAVTYQDLYKQLARVGAEAFKMIEKELDKPVSAVSTNPREPGGNPFG
jgi:hypothetical protein